ncbi:MAG: aspartate kinase [Synergistaceae bacterium]|nr:aspartate kinase [Synergistaceae bacterium]MBQ9574731.1 aspartate kinase [Synergistaceae bacterium]
MTVKFGGTSLADASQIRKAAEIVKANPERKYLVASAPGKRFSDDVKVTDLLYSCYSEFARGNDYSEVLAKIKERYASIITELGISFDIGAEIDAIEQELRTYPPADYLASRGEYINSKIIAEFLGWPFVDAAEVIFFNENGFFDGEKTFMTVNARLRDLPNAVIPGFYGSMPDGKIHTFSRGGSDVTGSIVARSVNADVYENWTDVSGMLSADPRIVDSPRPIEYITYTELRELSYMGASVLHEDAVFPVRKAGIPINIRNTNRPDDNGTLIAASLPSDVKRTPVTGIAGRKGFTSIRVERSQMNGQTGFGARLLYIFSRNGIPFEHCPTGIDTISVVVNSSMFDAKRDEILREIKNELAPDFITIEKNLAVIAVVGEGMVRVKGVAAKIFGSLADAGVNVRMIDQGSDELNIIVGVDESDYESAVKALYRAMIEQ